MPLAQTQQEQDERDAAYTIIEYVENTFEPGDTLSILKWPNIQWTLPTAAENAVSCKTLEVSEEELGTEKGVDRTTRLHEMHVEEKFRMALAEDDGRSFLDQENADGVGR